MNDAMVFGLGMLLIYIGGFLQGAFSKHQAHEAEIKTIKNEHRLEIAQLELKHQEKQLEAIKRYREEFEEFKKIINTLTDKQK